MPIYVDQPILMFEGKLHLFTFSQFILFISSLQKCSVVRDYRDVVAKSQNPDCLRSKVLRKIGRWATLTRLTLINC